MAAGVRGARLRVPGAGPSRRARGPRLLGAAGPAGGAAGRLERAVGSAALAEACAPRRRTPRGATPCAPSTARWRSRAGCSCGPPWDDPRPPLLGRGDRPGHGLRHRPAPHHPGVPGAARRAPGGRLPARRRVRIGGARDRGPAARASTRCGRSTMTRSRWRRPSPTSGATAWACASPGARSGPTPCPPLTPWSPTSRPRAWPCWPARSRGPRRGGWSPRGCVPARCRRTAARFAPLGLSLSREIVDDGWASVLLERS